LNLGEEVKSIAKFRLIAEIHITTNESPLSPCFGNLTITVKMQKPASPINYSTYTRQMPKLGRIRAREGAESIGNRLMTDIN